MLRVPSGRVRLVSGFEVPANQALRRASRPFESRHVVVERGAVLSMGVFLGASTKIVDRASGEVFYGRVPAYSVVVPGTLPSDKGGPALACAVIVKRVDERTRSKTSINELLRD